jgi:formate dehydrogenase maturation protein FdhE
LSRRIDRARFLARERAATVDLLTFYADLAEFQQTLLHEQLRVLRSPVAFADMLNAQAAAPLLTRLLQWLETRPQQGLASVSRAVRDRAIDDWVPLLDGYWRSGAAPVEDVDEVEQFVVEATLQPFAESVACSRNDVTHDGAHGTAGSQAFGRCRVCNGHPIVATLSERGQGARRSLVCGFCLSEWPTPRIVCPFCGEDDVTALHVYRAEEFPDVRIDSCSSCAAYIKTIDLAVNGAAVHVVDDLASVALDLWAAGRSYRKVRPNLLRL